MSKYRVSVDEIEQPQGAKSDAGFTNISLRFLITDKTVGSKRLSLFRVVFPAGFAAHKKHVHVDIEEVLFGIRGRGVVGFEYPDGKTIEYKVTPGVAVLIPKNTVHWFTNADQDKELELCGVLSAPDAGEFKPEDYKYVG